MNGYRVALYNSNGLSVNIDEIEGRVALYNSNGLSVNIDEIEGAPYYGVSLTLEITVEKE